MPSNGTQLLLFLSSYSPLFAITGYLETWGAGWPSLVSWAVAIISVVALLGFVSLARGMHRTTLTVSAAKPRDGDAIGYIVTYLVPFVAFIDPSVKVRFALLALILLICVLYVRAYMFYVNPVLALLGYRLYEVSLPDARTILLLTRRRFIARDEQIQGATLTEYVYLEPTA